MEQIEIPLLGSRESQTSVSADGEAMEVETESQEMSQGFSQQYTQRMEMAIDADEEMMDRIDFSRCTKKSDVRMGRWDDG